MPTDNQQFQFDATKFKELVLYICSKSDPSKLGAVKLHKALYYADMLRYVDTGQPVTGAVYRKRPLGPTADALLRTLSELQREGSLDIESVPYFGFQKREFRAKRAADLDRFNAAEISFVDDVIRFVCEENTAKEISELSHSLAWESVEFGDVMPYCSAFLMLKSQVPEEAFESAAREAEAIESERQGQGAVDYPLFSDVRRSVLAGDSATSKN